MTRRRAELRHESTSPALVTSPGTRTAVLLADNEASALSSRLALWLADVSLEAASRHADRTRVAGDLA